MTLNDLLRRQDFDPTRVLALRHRPIEQALRQQLPWLAADKPDVFNAYQQTQGPALGGAMTALTGSGFIASFIGHGPGKALFAGMFAINGSKRLSRRQMRQIRPYVELMGLIASARGAPKETPASQVWFDLRRKPFYDHWRGRLVVKWPPPERSWWRRAHRNEIAVDAILEESVLTGRMPKWDAVDLGWADLALLPSTWRLTLSQWRGVYYIFDTSDGKGYVGSAYGDSNILGRWQHYAARGHGGNVLLRGRDPGHFRFTILERLSPDLPAAEVIACESSWKNRLHTRQPFGLNEN